MLKEYTTEVEVLIKALQKLPKGSRIVTVLDDGWISPINIMHRVESNGEILYGIDDRNRKQESDR